MNSLVGGYGTPHLGLTKTAKGVKGGEAVGAGAYGCVFVPALPCRGSKRKANMVSKLMRAKDAKTEYEEAELARVMVETLTEPMKDFFILPLDPPCAPGDLTSADVRNVLSVCTNFERRERENLERELPSLRILNQVNGGMPIDGFLAEPQAKFARINTSIIQLLYAVRQMNLRGVIHGDMKGSNLVFNEDDNKVRVIDWGLMRTVHSEYSGEFWNAFWQRQDRGVFMFNSVPSLWVYRMFKLYGVSGPPESYAEQAHARLATLAPSNTGHLELIDRLFTTCNEARKVCGMPPFVYPTPRTRAGKALGPVAGTSQETTNILIAHAVAVLVVLNTSPARYVQLTDLVLRANIDVYGILTSYVFTTARCDTRCNVVLATLAPYLIDVAYAIRPFSIDDIARSLKPLSERTVRRCPAAVSMPLVFDVATAELIVDPAGARAFPYEPYVTWNTRPLYNHDGLVRAITQAGVRLRTGFGLPLTLREEPVAALEPALPALNVDPFSAALTVEPVVAAPVGKPTFSFRRKLQERQQKRRLAQQAREAQEKESEKRWAEFRLAGEQVRRERTRTSRTSERPRTSERSRTSERVRFV